MIAGYTDKGFKLIDFNSDNWHQDDWDNWQLLDALLEASIGDVALPVVGGTPTAITLDYTPDHATLANGTTIVFILTAAPTGATTLAIDAQPAKDLLILGASVASGDLQAGDTVKAVYNGTAFHVISPLRKFNRLSLVDGASGASANTDADNLVISSNLDAGISILCPSTQTAGIMFGDPANSRAGYIEYDHATDNFSIGRAGAEILLFSAAGMRYGGSHIAMNLTAANDFVITESAANVVRLGSSGTANGLTIDTVTGHASFSGNLTVTGTLTATVNVGTAIGTLTLANGGTGATDAAGARANLLLGNLSTLNAIDNTLWFGADLAIANGGTGASTAAVACANLGALETSGGTMTGNIVRSTKGVHPYFNAALMTGGEMFIQAIGSDPTANPGDIVFEY